MKTIFLFLTFINLLLASTNVDYKFTNSLINSHSPYLLNHAHNPINWFSWNQKSLNLAKKENKLLFVSIGYSTCHWCHVMEKESFTNLKIADILNKYYISIKVDKEQMPQIDKKYQMILSKLTKRRNGWPLHIIMTPNLDVLYIATYIPLNKKYGIQGLFEILPKMVKIYKNKILLDKLIKKNHNLIIQNSYKTIRIRDIKKEFVDIMEKRYDNVYSGFYKSPKFPLASNINLLLNIYELDSDKKALMMATKSLDAMAKGGIYDQIDGGFFRYSTLADWVIPHYEKMLYTNAELIITYLKAYKITNNDFYKKIAFDTLDFINDKFKDKNNLFFSASDADSLISTKSTLKQEGYYYTYTYDDTKKALLNAGINNADEILKYFGFEEFGNFDYDRNNPYIANIKKPKNILLAIKVLKQIRSKRVYPNLDTKRLASLNSMMIKALFKASLYDKKYLKIAQQSIKSLVKNTIVDNDIIKHQVNENNQTLLLEDYAFMIDALIQSYEISLNKKDLILAKRLYLKSKKEFFSKNNWYLDNHHFTKADFSDKYYTAPLSVLFNDMLKLSALDNDYDLLYFTKAQLKHYKNEIFNNLEYAPKAIDAILKTKYEYFIFKSNFINLKANLKTIFNIKYPYILVNLKNIKDYQLCTYTSCVRNSKSCIELVNYINQSKQPLPKRGGSTSHE